MQPIISSVAVSLFVIGLVGNGFEMRKICMSTEANIEPKNVFSDKRNFKWYALIGIALALWTLGSNYT